ncbi:nitronate monooxygenase [Roseovarius sp.]|uniref:nitronate monooxygenase n=1 Tax=Roseovarius sp. TaxID=1486281 RepID=UPI003562BD6F
MWPNSEYRELLWVEHPIIQAPTLGNRCPSIIGAVARSKWLGSLGRACNSPQTVRQEVDAVRALTDGASNLNFFIIGDDDVDPMVLESVRKWLKPWYEALGRGRRPAELPKPHLGFDDKQLDLVLSLNATYDSEVSNP